MEFFATCLVIYVCYRLWKWWSELGAVDTPSASGSASSSGSGNPPFPQRAATTTNAQAEGVRPGIRFRDISDEPVQGATRDIHFGNGPSAASGNQNHVDLGGLHDALTGAPLNPSRGIMQCRKCKVCYHDDSYQVLRQQNNSACIACGGKSLDRLENSSVHQRGRDHDPSLVTLADYAQHYGQVATFEGRVVSVMQSQRGLAWAAMFENASWKRGFKLVFPANSILAVGGVAFVKSLGGKTVRVRGLLVNHPIFGPEIIITERQMILRIST